MIQRVTSRGGENENSGAGEATFGGLTGPKKSLFANYATSLQGERGR